MIFSPHDSPFILVFTADARFVGGSHPSCSFINTNKAAENTKTQ